MENIILEIIHTLGSPSAPFLVLFVCLFFLALFYLARKGDFIIKTDKVRIGKEGADKEALIHQRQVEHVEMVIEGTFSDIPRHAKFDEWRTRYVLQKIIAEITRWCLYNHLDTSEVFIKLKQEAVWTIIQKYIWNDLYKTDEFRRYVNKVIKNLLIDLVQIRKVYSN